MIEDIFLLGELFERVQLEEVYADGKTFVDCIPIHPLDEIKEQFETEKDHEGFDLKNFVQIHFREPENNLIIASHRLPIVEHLTKLWDELLREPKQGAKDSLIPLPGQYIIPGGRFREIYYWDSYFTMLGLELSGKVEIIENMVDNFAHLIDTIGYIPNGNRKYYLGRSQPPFFCCMVELLSEIKGIAILSKYLPQLVREYQFWMQNRAIQLPDGTLLNHYSDSNSTPRPESFKEDHTLATAAIGYKSVCKHLRGGAESGWDFSSRWFANNKDLSTIHTTDILPVDLNCLLYNLENTIALTYKNNHNLAMCEKFELASINRKNAINKYLWNAEKRFYCDYDYVSQKQSISINLASLYPLFFRVATQSQADLVAIEVEQKLLCAGGLVTTNITTGEQWDAPNGWAPLQWISIKGFMNYGFNAFAKEIASRWMLLNEKVYESTGKMMEKYNVQDISLLAGGGEYPAQDGFGWTNGVYLKLNSIFPA